MTPEEQQREMLRNLDQTEQVLRANLAVTGLDGTARAHMEIALAHTGEAATDCKSGHCRTVMAVVQEHDVFARRLQATLQKSVQQFCSDRREGGGETKSTGRAPVDAAELAEPARRQQLDNLETAEDGLRANLHMYRLDEAIRAHIERALNHILEAYIATNEIGKARSVQRLVGDLEKMDGILGKVRRQPPPGALVKTIHV